MFSKMTMQHTRQAPGRDIHMHFSLASARSHTITASSKASATAATRNNPPPHPDRPLHTRQGHKLAKRRRGHHTCHSCLSLSPAPSNKASATEQPAQRTAKQALHSKQHSSRNSPPPHLKPRMGTDGEGRRNPARLCTTDRHVNGAKTKTGISRGVLGPRRVLFKHRRAAAE